jgi:hypothetical protein
VLWQQPETMGKKSGSLFALLFLTFFIFIAWKSCWVTTRMHGSVCLAYVLFMQDPNLSVDLAKDTISLLALQTHQFAL